MPSKPVAMPMPVGNDEEDKPKCPPRGAPAWMATFADIAILLMAFFVLILSFAEFNAPKFKQVAGSLRQAFGIQRDVPVFEQPAGTTILELNFSPSPDLAITERIIQETTDTTRPEIVSGTDDADSDGRGSVEGDGDDTGGEGQSTFDAIARAISDAVRGVSLANDVAVTAEDNTVTVNFADVAEEALPERLTQVAQAVTAVTERAEAQDLAKFDVALQGLEARLGSLAAAELARQEADAEAERAARRAAIAAAELTVALRQEIGQGLVAVETREEKVIVTVGGGGSFRSGRAELTAEARDIMARIAASAVGEATDVVVTGHTDSVPLSAASPFEDNWGLAAARAAAVVRALESNRGIPAGRLSALSRGETSPVADNATAEGRARNRRIEIELQY